MIILMHNLFKKLIGAIFIALLLADYYAITVLHSVHFVKDVRFYQVHIQDL
jgi:hypothetical protein